MRNARSHYRSLVDLVISAPFNSAALLVLTDGKSPKDQLVEVRKVFVKVVNDHNDAMALWYFELILQSIEDAHLMGMLEYDHMDGSYRHPEQEKVFAQEKEWEKAVKEARRQKANESLNLLSSFNHLPKLIKGRGFNISKDDEYFLKARKAMLEEVARWCFETADNEESDLLFEFFVGLELPREKEVENLKPGALREATHERIPIERIERHYLKLVQETGKKRLAEGKKSIDQRDEMCHVLANAWARNLFSLRWDVETNRSGVEDFAWVMRLFRPVAKSTNWAMEFLESQAKSIAITDAEILGLIGFMKESKSYDRKVIDSVPGRYRITYSSMRDVKITVTLLNDGIDVDSFKNRCVGIFSIGKEKIREWKRNGHGSFNITFRLLLEDKYESTVAEVIFDREEAI